ncbi:hypothetical protein PVAP13_1NG141900 [Panicum virgatum]|uniref:Uncharacterized protein n=1 Tax=Panicum virgatum TaxID=38727 RepID=A0A8T0WWM8_PANVG|nr:hypothetical protein PVAP13_1NG141900 [Panicum virgatum]
MGLDSRIHRTRQARRWEQLWSGRGDVAPRREWARPRDGSSGARGSPTGAPPRDWSSWARGSLTRARCLCLRTRDRRADSRLDAVRRCRLSCASWRRRCRQPRRGSGSGSGPARRRGRTAGRWLLGAAGRRAWRRREQIGAPGPTAPRQGSSLAAAPWLVAGLASAHAQLLPAVVGIAAVLGIWKMGKEREEMVWGRRGLQPRIRMSSAVM